MPNAKSDVSIPFGPIVCLITSVQIQGIFLSDTFSSFYLGLVCFHILLSA